MNSALIDFLSKEYPLKHIGKEVTDSSIKREVPSSPRFEIVDKKDSIVQPEGKGVSVFRNLSGEQAEVIDFEAYTNLLTPQNPEGACDFIINSIYSFNYIVFNELTASQSGYVKDFVQPTTGEKRVGKFSYAKEQMRKSIERFYEVNDFLDSYKQKTALFSCRLTDKTSNETMEKSMRSFRNVMKMVSNIRRNKWDCHGFTLQTRIYDNEFELR